MSVIDFRTSNYFTGMPYLLGMMLTPAGLLLFLSANFIGAVVLTLAGIVILTTHYRILIDVESKRYTEYVFMLGLKTAKETQAFSTIEYLFIKKIRVSQTLNSRASSTTIKKEQFEGYLRFSENAKVHLLTVDSKRALLKRLNAINTKLKLEIFDYSNETPVKI